MTLTVTDDDGLTDVTTRQVSPSAQQNPLAFIGANSTAGNRTLHRATVPAATQAGDLLVLFFVANSTTPTFTGPAGWNQVESQAGDSTTGRAYVRTAVANDAGSEITVTSSAFSKSVVTIAAYRGAQAGTPLSVTASALQTTSTQAHVTPTVNSPDGEQWLVSYWADRGSETTSWTLPGGVTQRSSAFGTPSGYISAVLGDSNGPVGPGQQGGLSASSNAVAGAAVTFSLLVNPG